MEGGSIAPTKLRVKKFWTDYTKDGRPVDWVEYNHVGKDHMAVQRARVGDLSCVIPIAEAPDNTAVLAANMRWNALKPQYEAWKQGQEIPDDGVPIGAWPGINPDQAEKLRNSGIRTVEEFASLGDAVAQRIRMPGVKPLRQQAQIWLDNRESAHVAEDLAAKDEQIAFLKSELEELKAFVITEKKAREKDETDLDFADIDNDTPPPAKRTRARK